LKKSGVVYACASKESSKKTVINEEGIYFVSFDPIDGSKLINSNLSIASIYGIFRAKDITGLTGKDMEGAALAIYSSRSSILLYNSHTEKVEELSFIRMGRKPKRWVVTKQACQINETSHNFSPEGIKAAYEKPGYMKCF
jgi:fructose-1,6-bisphosphatase I